MKKLLLILFSFFTIKAFAQFPSQQSQGSPSTQLYSKGAYGSDSGYVHRTSFADTTAANKGFLKNIPGIQIRTGNNIWMRNSTATAWIKFLNTVDGGGTGLTDGDKTDVEVSSFGSVFIVEGIQGESLPVLLANGFLVRRDGDWVYDTIAVSDLPDVYFDDVFFDGTGTFDDPITLINIYTKDQVDSAIAAGGGGGGYTDADAKAANPQSRHITLEAPTTSENIGLWFTDVAITITKVADVLIGSSSPSVTWQVNHASARNGSPNTLFSSSRVTTTASGATTTTFNDATIPANSWIWITTSANAGTVTQLEVTLIWTID